MPALRLRGGECPAAKFTKPSMLPSCLAGGQPEGAVKDTQRVPSRATDFKFNAEGVVQDTKEMLEAVAAKEPVKKTSNKQERKKVATLNKQAKLVESKKKLKEKME